MSETETPETPAEAPAEPEETEEATDASATPAEGSGAADEAAGGPGAESDGAPAGDAGDEASEEASGDRAPEVVNDGFGQHVNMPDGSVVYTRSHSYPVTNAEWETYERTHSGDQLRYPYKPGDQEYNANSDPSVPNSWLANQINVQLASFPERLKDDPAARPSPTWDALQPTYQGALTDAIETGGGSGKVEA